MTKKPNFEQMMAALNRRDIQLLRSLMAAGADPNAVKSRNGDKLHVLAFAASALFSDGVAILLEAGADPNATETGQGVELTALQHSIVSGIMDYERFPEIMRCGDPVERMRIAETIRRTERAKIVDLLLRLGGNPNLCRNGHLPLGYACSEGNYDLALRLIEGGACVKSVPTGCTPPLLEVATHIPQDSSTDEVNAAKRTGFERTIKLLLDHGAPVDAQDTSGVTALMGAARSGGLALANLLLEKGADVNHEAKEGCTPLMFAACFANGAVFEKQDRLALEIVKRLVKLGADPSRRAHGRVSSWRINVGETALDIADRNAAGRQISSLVTDYLKTVMRE